MKKDKLLSLNYNSVLILKYIISNSGVIRSQIAKELGFSKTVVSDNVKNLINKGFVKEEKSVGRQIPLYVISENVFYININVSEKCTTTEMFNLNNTLVKSERLLPYKDFSTTEFLNSLVKSCFRATKLGLNRVIKINLSLPDLFDIEYLSFEHVEKVLFANLGIEVALNSDVEEKNLTESEYVAKEEYVKTEEFDTFLYIYLANEITLSFFDKENKILDTKLFDCIKVDAKYCLKDYFYSAEITVQAVKIMASVIVNLYLITGCPNFVIGGQKGLLLNNFKTELLEFCNKDLSQIHLTAIINIKFADLDK